MANCLPSMLGKFRNSIVIETKAETQDDFGGYTTDWTTGANARAFIKQMKGNERIIGAQNTPVDTYRFTIRYNSYPSLSAEDRIVYDSRNFEIKRINNVEERNYVYEIDAVEGIGT